MQRPIRAGTRSGETKTDMIEPRAIIMLGKKVCIRWNVYTRVNSRDTPMFLHVRKNITCTRTKCIKESYYMYINFI